MWPDLVGGVAVLKLPLTLSQETMDWPQMSSEIQSALTGSRVLSPSSCHLLEGPCCGLDLVTQMRVTETSPGR